MAATRLIPRSNGDLAVRHPQAVRAAIVPDVHSDVAPGVGRDVACDYRTHSRRGKLEFAGLAARSPKNEHVCGSFEPNSYGVSRQRCLRRLENLTAEWPRARCERRDSEGYSRASGPSSGTRRGLTRALRIGPVTSQAAPTRPPHAPEQRMRRSTCPTVVSRP